MSSCDQENIYMQVDHTIRLRCEDTPWSFFEMISDHWSPVLRLITPSMKFSFMDYNSWTDNCLILPHMKHCYDTEIRTCEWSTLNVRMKWFCDFCTDFWPVVWIDKLIKLSIGYFLGHFHFVLLQCDSLQKKSVYSEVKILSSQWIDFDSKN